jgi:hypothetical protein
MVRTATAAQSSSGVKANGDGRACGHRGDRRGGSKHGEGQRESDREHAKVMLPYAVAINPSSSNIQGRLRLCSRRQREHAAVILLIFAAVLTIVSVVISYFLTSRSGWRKIVLVVGIVGAALSFVQGYRNLERAGGLLNEIGGITAKTGLLGRFKTQCVGPNWHRRGTIGRAHGNK